VTTTVTLQGGETQVRTLTLPPWPAILGIPGRKPTTRTKTITTKPTTRIAKPLPPFTTRPFPTYPGSSDPSETQPVTEPTKTWPPEWEIIPVETEVPKEGSEDDDDHDFFHVSCKLWFFSVRQLQRDSRKRSLLFSSHSCLTTTGPSRPIATNYFGRCALIGLISVSRFAAGSGTCPLVFMGRKSTFELLSFTETNSS
jgi:hypothetical protein